MAGAEDGAAPTRASPSPVPAAPDSAANAAAIAGAERSRGRRSDHAFAVPLARLFDPYPDPTLQFPGQSAVIDGYVASPNRVVTLAVTAAGPTGFDMLDAVWALLRRRGIGIRHLTVLNDRGQIVSLMTVRADLPEATARLLRSLLMVPVRAQDGRAEIHFLTSPEEASAVAETVAKTGSTPEPPAGMVLPVVRETGPLRPEDWAFLGLLTVVGAFDGPEGVPPNLLADALGIEPEVFAERVRVAERGLDGVVEGLFGAAARSPAAAAGRA